MSKVYWMEDFYCITPIDLIVVNRPDVLSLVISLSGLFYMCLYNCFQRLVQIAQVLNLIQGKCVVKTLIQKT